jgi:hypothetical protein
MTAVEWLCNKWLYLDQQFDMCLIDRNVYWDKLRQIQEQAKEMEKEQIVRAVDNVYFDEDGNEMTGEEYYNTISKL